MEEHQENLLKFSQWLQEDTGQSSLSFDFCEFENVLFLLCHKKSKNYELKFLPAFHLFVTYETTVLKYKVSLINFAGKLLDSFNTELPEDLSGEKIPDFVQKLVDDKLVLCRGLSSQKSASKKTLVEDLNGKIVIRSRKCRYAVAYEDTVCEECTKLEASKNKSALPKKAKVLKKSKLKNEYQIVDVNVDSGQYETVSGQFCDSSSGHEELEQIEIKIEPDLCYLPEALPDCSSIRIYKIEPPENIVEQNPEEEVESENENVRKSERQKLRRKKFKIRSKKLDNVQELSEGDEEKSRKKSSKKELKVRKICANCNEGFGRKYLFDKHLKENRECKLFLRAKRKEERKSAPPKPVDPSKYRQKCSICFWIYGCRKFYDADQAQHEAQIKGLDDPVECPTCEKIIERRRDLNIHFEEEHTKNTGAKTDELLCLECLKSSTRRWIKSHYMAVHSGKEKKFLCNLCGFRSRLNSNLRKHIASIHGLSPDLSTKLSGYICDQCGNTYPSFQILKIHINHHHTNGRIHPCNECSKEFYTLKALMVHKVCVHLNIRPFKCRSCSYTSGTMSGIFKHYPRLHGGVIGGRSEVVVLEDKLKLIRKTLNYNYCFHSVGNYF